MKAKKWQIGGWTLGLISLALLMLSMVWWPTRTAELPVGDQTVQINLALRETTDRLLDLAGDSTSTIPPVQRKNDSCWILPLQRPFLYDSLPPILRRALERNGVQAHYNLSVYRCQDQELILGYNAMTYNLEGEVPCGGRDLQVDCLNVAFTLLELPPSPLFSWPMVLIRWGLTSLLLLGGIALYWRRVQQPTPPVVSAPPLPTTGTTLPFGQSALDVSNQKLWVKEVEKSLTFRETKLLHFLVQHANQVLDRERILEAIWQDEGLLVGRSLDVFVSRLRKLLQEDDRIRITSVHGVGYRFEVG